VLLRKAHYINVISYKDIKALQALRCCGYMTKEQLNQIISKSRIKAFCHEKVIEKCVIPNRNKSIECYRFTDKGQDWCNKRIDEMNSLSYYRSCSPLHDIALAEKYLSLLEEQRNTWKTESDLRREFKQSLEQMRELDYVRYVEISFNLSQGAISMPDCTYQVEGAEQAYDVITNNYGEAEINSKIEYSFIANIPIELYKI
jgi:hypothetical protein